MPKLRNRVAGLDASLESLQQQVDGQKVGQLRTRVAANEAVLNELNERFVDIRSRVSNLQQENRALKQRVKAIEEQLGLEIQPLDE